MYFKKTMFILCISIFLIFSCFSYSKCAESSYVWNNISSGLLETVSDTETDLKLESGSAILIEQTTRFCSL